MQLTVREASKLLQVQERQILRWVDEGKLPAYQIEEQFRFNRAELLEWATTHNIQNAADLYHKEGEVEAPWGLHKALSDGGIHYGIPGSDREAVLRAVVERLKLPEDADREALVRIFLAREAMGSTGVGDGIAIPHVRSPIVLHVQQPTITLCFLQTPIDFKAVDGRPVHTLFSMITPTVRSHLQLLSELASALCDPKFKSLLAHRAQPGDILAEARRLTVAHGKK